MHSIGYWYHLYICIYIFMNHTICHFNPAITLAAIVTLKLPVIMGMLYIFAELCGLFVACCLVKVNFSRNWYATMEKISPNRLDPEISNTSLFFMEFTLTAILCFVIFENKASSKRNRPQPHDDNQTNRLHITPFVLGFTVALLNNSRFNNIWRRF
jgi:glycerol uptake facilitator-like aquaporin